VDAEDAGPRRNERDEEAALLVRNGTAPGLEHDDIGESHGPADGIDDAPFERGGRVGNVRGDRAWDCARENREQHEDGWVRHR
jgi:hypothetical protein